MNSKKITAALLVAAMSLPVGACSNNTEETFIAETTAATTTEAVETAAPEPVATEPVETEAPVPVLSEDSLYDPSNPLAVNPISGLQTMDPSNVGRRSVAVVVNNSHSAMPQRGISAADAIYEYQTEGGQTRLLCVFADVNTIPEIGSLRSARILSTDLAAGNNSVFIHFGRNARVPEHISSYGIDHIDGNSCSAGVYSSSNYADGYVDLPSGLFFWRDAVWKSQRAIEHTAVSDGRHILEAIEYNEINMTDNENNMLFNFVPGNSSDIATGDPCEQINVYFSGTNDDALFVYDPISGLYSKSQYGNPQIDETTGTQIAFTNVFVLYANIQPHGDTTIDAYLQDGGEGWYVSGGRIIPITWSKNSPVDPIVVFNEAGEELEVNRGRSYICIVDNDMQNLTTITSITNS
ncbi:MAG: DUF3048 domain-containing protein [Clostridiales bacterium]|nr:DUF3048 domain-containing protein [Clostridiales bacterium]